MRNKLLVIMGIILVSILSWSMAFKIIAAVGFCKFIIVSSIVSAGYFITLAVMLRRAKRTIEDSNDI